MTTYTLARTDKDREEVYRLRYACYRRTGAIPPRSDTRFSDAFDEMPNHFSFLVRDAIGEPSATVRISVVRPLPGWTESPGGHVYADHPRWQALVEDSFVEANRLCFAEQTRRDTFVRLTAHMAALAEHFGVEWLVACPRVEHAHIYQRLFGFRPVAEPRRYFGVAFDTRLLAIRLGEIRRFVASNRAMTGAWSQAAARLEQLLPAPVLYAPAPGIAISASSGK